MTRLQEKILDSDYSYTDIDRICGFKKGITIKTALRGIRYSTGTNNTTRALTTATPYAILLGCEPSELIDDLYDDTIDGEEPSEEGLMMDIDFHYKTLLYAVLRDIKD